MFVWINKIFFNVNYNSLLGSISLAECVFCPPFFCFSLVSSTVWSFRALGSSWWPESDRSTGTKLMFMLPWKNLWLQLRSILSLCIFSRWQCWTTLVTEMHQTYLNNNKKDFIVKNKRRNILNLISLILKHSECFSSSIILWNIL